MSDDIIDLNAERNKRVEPDPKFVKHDDYGRKLYVFTCSYSMEDRRYCIEIWAYDFPDAEAKVAAMQESLQVDGQLFGEVPA